MIDRRCRRRLAHRLRRDRRLLRVLLLLAVAAGAVLVPGNDSRSEEGSRATIELTSPAFENGGKIPKKFTCDGADVSPPLAWSNVPEGTMSLALVCDDPDAPVGTWVHWVLYGVPPDTTSLRQGVPAGRIVRGVGRQGRNDFKRLGYGGPCPPPGKPHRYFFKVYALDVELVLEPGAKKSELEKAMRDHILAEGRLVGRYGR